MKDFGKIIISLLLAVGLFVLGMIVGNKHGKEDIEEVRDTITFVDTVKVEKPVPKDSVILKVKKVYMKVSAEPTLTENEHLIGGNNMMDSVLVDVPIEQKVYEDSTYKAWVSGYLPSLDSINVYQRKEIITITKFEKPKKWSIGIQGGIGAGREGFTPYIGIGVQYNLVSF